MADPLDNDFGIRFPLSLLAEQRAETLPRLALPTASLRESDKLKGKTDLLNLGKDLQQIFPAMKRQHFRVRVVGGTGLPVALERVWVQLLATQEKPFVFMTDKDGNLEFDGLVDAAGTYIPRLVFPDILESFSQAYQAPPKTLHKRSVAEGARYKNDGNHHLLLPELLNEIHLNRLTAEDKFQYYRMAFESARAFYTTGSPAYYQPDQRKPDARSPQFFQFRRNGTSCNPHMNTFMGFWYNYNLKYSNTGGSTTAATLPMFDRANHVFGPGKQHRGYSDFVAELPEALGTRNVKLVNDVVTFEEAHYEKIYQHAVHIRLAEYFDQKGNFRSGARARLMAALGDFNVYSISDLLGHVDSAANAVRRWLTQQLQDDATLGAKAFVFHGITYVDKLPDAKKQVKGVKYRAVATLNANQLLEAAWELDANNAAEAECINSLRKLLNADHHGGILLKRGPGGVSPVGHPADKLELWTFSADTGDFIHHKAFNQNFMSKVHKFPYYAIWALAPLEPGGFAPNLTDPAVEKDVDFAAPPRFVGFP